MDSAAASTALAEPAPLVDVRPIVASALTSLAPMLRGHDVDIRIGLLVPVRGEPFQLRLLFQTLMREALRACIEEQPSFFEMQSRLDDGNAIFSLVTNATSATALDRLAPPVVLHPCRGQLRFGLDKPELVRAFLTLPSF